MLIEWKDKYSVKVSKFDGAHKVLIDMINQVHENMTAGKSMDVIRDIVYRLFDYAESHFMEEEKLMTLHDYPHLEAHKEQHQKFIHEVQQLKDKLDKGSNLINIQVLYFLKDWLTNHIMTTDMKYSDFFNDKGIK